MTPKTPAGPAETEGQHAPVPALTCDFNGQDA